MTTVRFGMKVCLRASCQGRYLSVSNHVDDAAVGNGGSGDTRLSYGVSVSGSGVGDFVECFLLVNANFRDDVGPVRFGDVVALRATAARERCLAASTTGAVGLWRNMIGQSEKWSIVETDDEASTGRAPTLRSEQGAFRATKFVRFGDHIALRSAHGGNLLAVHDAFRSVGGGGGGGASDGAGPLPGQVCAVDEASLQATGGSREVWQLLRAGTPSVPKWNMRRPYLTGEFLLHPQRHGNNSDTAPPLSSFPVPVQEQMLLEELLSAMMGVEGRYVRVAAGDSSGAPPQAVHDVKFAIDVEAMDRSLAYLASRILPLCRSYIRVSRFVETRGRYEFGLTAHAFAAAVNLLLKEYLVLVAQLEHQLKLGKLSLQKLWFFVQPSLRTLDILDAATASAAGVAGGALLNQIHGSMSTGGDERASQLRQFLMQKASLPYFDMLESWIYRGSLDDPYNEFMVREEESLRKENIREDFNATYWDCRYTVREDQVCNFLASYTDKVLTAGKYLNVVRECGRDIECPFAGPMEFSMGEPQFGELIDTAYSFASQTLLELLLRENSLVERLRSIKHYFLLDQGDFFVHFMDAAEDELRQEVDQISHTRLESLLALSMQTSIAVMDPYKDDLTCAFSPYNLIHHLDAIHSWSGGIAAPSATESPARMQYGTQGLKGIEAFMLDYRVRWPLSIVVSKRALTKYQLIFRHLFFCKYVERRLFSTWQNHQSTKELDLRSAMGPSYCLRQRMLHFMQNLVYYFMFEVLEPRWHDFEAKLRTVKTVDEVLRHHNEFQDTCLKECLLTNQELLKILTKLMTTSLLFSEQIKRFTETNQVDETSVQWAAGGKKTAQERQRQRSLDVRRERIRVQSEHIHKVVAQDGYVRMIQKFEENHDSLLAAFMDKLWSDAHLQYHSHLSNLCTRLDFNGFYTR